MNEKQLAAVNAPNKPLLVIAGAGTGKTRVLIERVIKLLSIDKIDHRKILIITFTNKARDEIKKRISDRVGSSLIPSYIHTFHAFFHKLLLRDVDKLDPKLRDFKLLDENDQRAIVRKIIKNMNLRDVSVRPAISAISFLKINDSNLTNSQLIDKVAWSNDIDPKCLIDIYKTYQSKLREDNFFDYDDLEIFTLKILQIPEVRDFWRSLFQSILIDEFQDTSLIQMEIVKQLATKDTNIFCVGDPDQSIYGFRGAKPNVCNEFKNFFQADVIKLEENYRSTKHILEVSNHLINLNTRNSHLSKNLRSVRSGISHLVQCIEFDSEWDEADWILDEIKRIMKIDSTARLKDFVILYRANNLSKPFEISISKRKWAFEVTNATEFFSRLEIQFIVSYLKLLYFHEENGSSVWINTISDIMKMGIGEKSWDKFFDFLKNNLYSFIEGLEKIDLCSGISSKVKSGITNLKNVLKELMTIRDSLSLKDVIEKIVELSGYDKFVEQKQEFGRLENIRSFAYSLSDNLKSNKDIVKEIALRSTDVKKEFTDDFLLLSTVHQAKGLEYKYVFVAKMTEDVFPHYKCKSTQEELDEERRLAYVAFTRAKDKLYITSSPSSKNPYQKPSNFISEIKWLSEHLIFSKERRSKHYFSFNSIKKFY